MPTETHRILHHRYPRLRKRVERESASRKRRVEGHVRRLRRYGSGLTHADIRAALRWEDSRRHMEVRHGDD